MHAVTILYAIKMLKINGKYPVMFSEGEASQKCTNFVESATQWSRNRRVICRFTVTGKID